MPNYGRRHFTGRRYFQPIGFKLISLPWGASLTLSVAKMVMKWVSAFCSRYHSTMFDSIPEGLPVKQIHPRILMFLFFVASLSFALIINVFPTIVSFLSYSRQFGKSATFSFSGHSNADFSVGTSLQKAYSNDLCSRTFVMLASRVPEAKNGVSTQQMTITDRDKMIKFDGSGEYSRLVDTIYYIIYITWKKIVKHNINNNNGTTDMFKNHYVSPLSRKNWCMNSQV